MDGLSEMRALSSCDIIGVVVEKHLRFKTAGMVLEEREPDDDAARPLNLREIMMNGAALKVREGAAYGVGCLGEPRLVPLVQHALVRERIRRGTAAYVMWKLGGIASDSVVTLLKSPNDRERALGVDLAMYLLQKPQRANVINVIRDAMSSVPLAPRTRRQLEERLARSSAP